MVLNEEKSKEFEEVTKPLLEWLIKNYHPYVTAIVTPAGIELLEGVVYIPITTDG